MTEAEILTVLNEEADRLWLQYLYYKDQPEFDGVAKQVFSMHHQARSTWNRIANGEWL